MATTDFVTKMHQIVCGMQGHDNLLEFGRSRLSLKCMSCGHETPGWELPARGAATSRAAASRAATPTPERRRLVPQLEGARRLA